MNHTPAPTKFSLHVSSANAGEVWPFDSRNDKELDERIQARYYADEDEAMTSFEVTDMDDLQRLLKFYDGRKVEMSLHTTLDAPEFTASSSLASQWRRGIQGSFRMLENDALSPATAANKIVAIAHAMQRWESREKSAPTIQPPSNS